MNQSKIESFIETIIGTVLGFLVSYLLSHFLYPFYGVPIPVGIQAKIVVWFTAASLVRGYLVRRFFANGFVPKIKRGILLCVIPLLFFNTKPRF